MNTDTLSADAATSRPDPIEQAITAVLDKHDHPTAGEVADALRPLIGHLRWKTQADMTAISLEGIHDWAREENATRDEILSKVASMAKDARRVAEWEQTQIGES